MSTDGFPGVIGNTVPESTPAWPRRPQPPEGAPNVIFIVLDDTGFAHLGCYGSDIETPNMDRLAAGGLRYNNFHTTALCSPTRACLLTGRNHHSVGVGRITEITSGFPGYYGQITDRAATLAEVLRSHGYNTIACGKWHLLPNSHTSAAGPFDQWPLGRGFDHYYGFLGGETDQWRPDLAMGNERIQPPDRPGYHLTEDLVDHAIGFVRDQKSLAPEKPFFLYLAFGATHAPHHAPKEFIEKYRGRFDEGWDAARDRIFARQKKIGVVPPDTELAPRNDGVKAWTDLTDNERRLFARMQEVFAGFLDHTDTHIGRVLDFLEEIGQFENTLIVLISDNGASQEGGPIGQPEQIYFNTVTGGNIDLSVEDMLEHIDELGGPLHHNHYPTGWAQAGNTPLKRYKQNTHGGGIRDPMIVHWPARIKDGGAIRNQYHHVSDVTPTVLETIGIEAPTVLRGIEQMPVEGTSFAYSFGSPEEPTHKETQYYEMLGHRAIWHDGWKAVAFHPPGTSFENDRWELYHLDNDFSESSDLADEHPERLRELVDLWWDEARKHNVLPISDMVTTGFSRPGGGAPRRAFTFYAGATAPSMAAPNAANRSHRITAHIDRADTRQEGALVAQGGRHGGYTLYIKDNRLVYEYNFLGLSRYAIRSASELAPGTAELRFDFLKTGECQGIGRLFANGDLIGEGEVPQTTRIGLAVGLEPMNVGRDDYTPVSEAYACPFAFSGKLHRVEVFLGGREVLDPRAELDALLATQ
jgi:arylsulfatase A-like enzyme